jgi:hypothetical protein
MGEGWGVGGGEARGPSWGPVHNAFDAGSIHYLGKRFPGPNPLAQVMNAARIKSIMHGAV